MEKQIQENFQKWRFEKIVKYNILNQIHALKGLLVKMKEEILELIIKLTGYEDLRNNINVDLVEEDILDSLAFIQLISELEDKYDIEIQPTQVLVDTWRSIDGITKMVEEKIEKNQ